MLPGSRQWGELYGEKIISWFIANNRKQNECMYIKFAPPITSRYPSAIHYLFTTHVRLEDEIKQPTFKSEAHKAFLNILYTAGYLAQQQATALKPYHLTHPQYNILRILRGQHPQPATVALLIERMLDKTSNASRIVDKLEDKALVTRHVCPSNRRAVDILITPAGLDLLRQLDHDPQADLLGGGLRNLSEDEMRQLSYLLDKIRTAD